MSRFTPARLATTAVLLVLVFTGPWWLAVGIFVVAVRFFSQYYEACLPAFIFDVLYGFPLATPLHFQFVASALVIIIVATSDELRTHFI